MREGKRPDGTPLQPPMIFRDAVREPHDGRRASGDVALPAIGAARSRRTSKPVSLEVSRVRTTARSIGFTNCRSASSPPARDALAKRSGADGPRSASSRSRRLRRGRSISSTGNGERCSTGSRQPAKVFGRPTRGGLPASLPTSSAPRWFTPPRSRPPSARPRSCWRCRAIRRLTRPRPPSPKPFRHCPGPRRPAVSRGRFVREGSRRLPACFPKAGRPHGSVAEVVAIDRSRRERAQSETAGGTIGARRRRNGDARVTTVERSLGSRAGRCAQSRPDARPRAAGGRACRSRSRPAREGAR